MNYVKLAIFVGITLFCRSALAMLAPSEGHDKYITQVDIDGGSLSQIDQIFILPYTGGPHRRVQEVPGVTLNGIQDYAVSEQMAGRWKSGQTLVYHLEKPILVNITTQNPECLVGIKLVGQIGPVFTADMWYFPDIDDLGESNTLKINLSAPRENKVAILAPKKK